jgi:methionyl-tRNA formyltransferase
VHQLAERHDIDVQTPKSLRTPDAVNTLKSYGADLVVVVAYGLILPQEILDVPPLGCINIHASLLPRWRGAAPIHRAVLAGDPETGITLMRMDAGLDTGPMLMTAKLDITPEMTTGMVHDALKDQGAELLLHCLDKIPQAQPQPKEGVTYADKITKEEAHLDFRQSAEQVVRQVRGYNPWPAAFIELDGHKIIVLSAQSLDEGASDPGTILDDTFKVACGTGSIRIDTLQIPGKKPMSTHAYKQGHPIPVGKVIA